MVNLGKEGQVSATDNCLQVFQRRLDSKRTGSALYALDRGRCSRSRWLVHVFHLSALLRQERGTALRDRAPLGLDDGLMDMFLTECGAQRPCAGYR